MLTSISMKKVKNVNRPCVTRYVELPPRRIEKNGPLNPARLSAESSLLLASSSSSPSSAKPPEEGKFPSAAKAEAEAEAEASEM